MPKVSASSKIIIVASILFSGVCWYFSSGLTGDFWYLQWIAPVPILYVALRTRGWQSFLFSFIAYLIGRLSWLPYLLSVVPTFLAIMFTLLLPLVFALVVTTARKIVVNSSSWLTVFSFPVLFTSFEYLMFIFSKDGTIASVAYSQCNFLPALQVASLTGMLGITFLLSFIPFAVAIILNRRKNNQNIKPLLITTIALAAIIFIFGEVRLTVNSADKSAGVIVGLTVADEHLYKKIYEPNTALEIQIAQTYLDDVPALAAQAARIIVMPEKSIIVNDSSYNVVEQMFANAAINNHVYLVAGVTKIKKGFYENSSWVFNDNGKLVADYQKVNLFEGEAADGFVPGKNISVFAKDGDMQGTAICKDLDFQKFVLQYAKANVSTMYVPAWDFVQDGWLHSRMAMMRSIEGGYAMVRNAREGRLTINDYCGKVLFETSCENRKHTTLLGKLPLGRHNTFYSKTGDWFGILNLAGSICFIILLMTKRKSTEL